MSLQNRLAGFMPLDEVIIFDGARKMVFHNYDVNSEGQKCRDPLVGNLCGKFTHSGLPAISDHVTNLKVEIRHSVFSAPRVCELTTFLEIFIVDIVGKMPCAFIKFKVLDALGMDGGVWADDGLFIISH